MIKIIDVNDLCDAIVDSTLDEAPQRALIDDLETVVALSSRFWLTTTASSPTTPNTSRTAAGYA